MTTTIEAAEPEPGGSPLASAALRYLVHQPVLADEHGRPLVETMGKDWKTKSSTDGDEGPEENWGWEES